MQKNDKNTMVILHDALFIILFLLACLDFLSFPYNDILILVPFILQLILTHFQE